MCIQVIPYRMERGAGLAIITENYEPQAKSVEGEQTDWNAMGSQRKEGKPAQRRIPAQFFPNQWRTRPTVIQNQWTLRRINFQIQCENHGLSFTDGWGIRANTLQSQRGFCEKLSNAIGNHIATCQSQSVIHPKSFQRRLLAHPKRFQNHKRIR